MEYYGVLKKELAMMAGHMKEERIHVISARPLSPEEAIGKPDRTDYPILKGWEVMVEAAFRDARGQAFTDMPGNFEDTLQGLLDFGLLNNFERPVPPPFTVTAGSALTERKSKRQTSPGYESP